MKSNSKKEEKNPNIVSHVTGHFSTSLSVPNARVSVLSNGTFVISNNNSLELIDALQQRQQPIINTAAPISALAAVSNNTIFVGLENGDIHLVDIEKKAIQSTLHTNQQVLSVVPLSEQKIFCSHSYSLEIWDLSTHRCDVKRDTSEPSEVMFRGSYRVLNSQHGCYLLRSFYRTLELLDADTLSVVHKYKTYNNEDNDFDTFRGILEVLADGESFILSYISSERDGYPKIAVGNIHSSALTTLATLCIPGMLCMLIDGSILENDVFDGLRLCDMSDSNNVTYVNLLYKANVGMPNTFFHSLPDGRVLMIDERAYDIIEFKKIQDYLALVNPSSTIIADCAGFPTALQSIFTDYLTSPYDTRLKQKATFHAAKTSKAVQPDTDIDQAMLGAAIIASKQDAIRSQNHKLDQMIERKMRQKDIEKTGRDEELQYDINPLREDAPVPPDSVMAPARMFASAAAASAAKVKLPSADTNNSVPILQEFRRTLIELHPVDVKTSVVRSPHSKPPC